MILPLPGVIRRPPKVSTLKDNIYLEPKLMHLFIKKTSVASPHLRVKFSIHFLRAGQYLNNQLSNFMDQEYYTLRGEVNC